MAQPLILDLSVEQRDELESIRDTHPRPYACERAAALLKIAAGQSPRQVVRYGLFKSWEPDTVYSWYHR